MTKELSSKLNLPEGSVDISVSGVDGVRVYVSELCNITIQSLHSTFTTNISCLILPAITDNLPTVSVDPNA